MKWILVPVLLASAACSATTASESIGHADGPAGTCTAENLEELIGREPTAQLGQEALQRSGSRTLRWIRPGDAVTMDFRSDRLNIHLDSRHRVERFTCG